MKSKSILVLLIVAAFFSAHLKGQNSTFRSLLPERIMDEIIGEASGETALNHIIEMAAYNHNRPSGEYSGNFFETDYIISRLNEYGLEEITVNRYPGGTSWDGISGELWEVSPGLSKLADYQDLTAMLASGSTNTDVEAELVWVGEGSEEEIEKAGVEGKIVLTSGSPRSVHNYAVSKGALGVVSFNSPRPLEVDLAIPISGISGWGNTDTDLKFGFSLPPREGHILRDRLRGGEKIKVHATVRSQELDCEYEVPECVIRGTDPDADEVILSAHLFEGFVKQGANDNISGSAAILEVARMLKSMIDEGILEKPKRNIRFIWVPEFSGTIPWAGEHMDLMKKTLCNINLDMVGINLADSKSFLCMQRTTYGNPHYINDVMENYYEYVGITNREGLAITDRGGYLKRIVAPSGSDDPFYYRVDDHYGASDHEVFNDPAVGVPGIMMITWPDLYYHTSQDRADKCDPTQMKRVCVITASAAYTIASARDEMADKLAAEILGNSVERIGAQLRRATDMLYNSGSDDFQNKYKLGYNYIRASFINEKATLNSVNELYLTDKNNLQANYGSGLEKVFNAMAASYDIFAGNMAERLGSKKPVYELTKQEKEAEKAIPELNEKIHNAGYGAGRTIMRGAGELTAKYPVKNRVDIDEILRLCNGTNNIYEIKILLDTQMKTGETQLSDIINTVKILEVLGYIKL